MADHPLKLARLRKILRSFGIDEDPSRSRGSHTVFFKQIDGRWYTYPVPTNHSDVGQPYVRGCRKKFRLTAEDGVSDEVFYGAG